MEPCILRVCASGFLETSRLLPGAGRLRANIKGLANSTLLEALFCEGALLVTPLQSRGNVPMSHGLQFCAHCLSLAPAPLQNEGNMRLYPPAQPSVLDHRSIHLATYSSKNGCSDLSIHPPTSTSASAAMPSKPVQSIVLDPYSHFAILGPEARPRTGPVPLEVWILVGGLL